MEDDLEHSTKRSQANPEVEEPPTKRSRDDSRKEDRSRGKRLFGALLGTLQKFKDEDKSNRSSDAAKRREQVSQRIAAKLYSENSIHNEIAQAEKDLRSLRITTDSSEFVLKHKEIAMSARHSSLLAASRFLNTSLPPESPLVFETTLLNPSPLPTAQGPSLEQTSHYPKPLYFLPKILSPHQEDVLRTRTANIDELIADEAVDMEKEKAQLSGTTLANRDKIQALTEKIQRLRAQIKTSAEAPTAKEATLTREDIDVDGEESVQIRGDDGDIEVEY